MLFREAHIRDVKEIQVVRNAVKENSLSDPALITHDACVEYMTLRGKAWVCEVDAVVVGFAFVDLQQNNIWALFVHPDFSGLGIGKKLHKMMMDWYFDKTKTTVWLSTSPNTRAEVFYEMQGWKKAGMYGNEIKFEMTFADWKITDE